MALLKRNKVDDGVIRVLEHLEQVWPIFWELYREARRNTDYYQGRQWTRQEVQRLEQQGREPYVWNKMQTYVKNILGMQIQTRLDFTVIAPTPEKQDYVDILQELLSWATRVNYLDRLETEVFLHGLLQGVAITQVRWELSDFWGGYPKVERVPIYQMLWDASITDWSLANAMWCARVVPVLDSHLDMYYPDKAEEIRKNWSESSIARLPFWGIMTRNQEAMTYLTGRRRADDVYWIIEWYESIRRPIYVVVDEVYNNSAEYDSKSVAEAYRDGLLLEYSKIPDINLIDEDGRDLVYIATTYRNIIRQKIIVGNTLLEERDTDLTSFPYQLYMAESVDGGIVAPVNTLVYPQRFLNKVISEWDNVVSRTGRGTMTVVESLLPRGWTAAKIAQLRSQTAATIPVLRHDAIQSVPDHTTTPDIPNLINVVQNFMMEAGGGQNILGLQENAAESGKAVRARQAAAGLGRVPLFYNLSTWKRDVCVQLLWYLRNYLTEGQISYIIGHSQNQQLKSIEMNREIFDTLKSLETDIAVTITTDNDTARQEVYNQLLQMMSTGVASVLSPQTLLTLLVEMNPHLPREVRDRIVESEPIVQQIMRQQQQQRHEEKIKQQAADSVKRSQIKEAMRQEAMSDLQQPPQQM